MLETVATLLLASTFGAVPEAEAKAYVRTKIIETMRRLPVVKAATIGPELKEDAKAEGDTTRYRTQADKDWHVADIQRRLSQPTLNFPPLDVGRDPIGSVGRLTCIREFGKSDAFDHSVFQVLGKTQALLQQHCSRQVMVLRQNRAVGTKWQTREELFMLDDFPTEGWVDKHTPGNKLVGKLFVLSGTKTYQSAAGPRTVKRVTLFQLPHRMCEEVIAAETREAEARKVAKAKTAEVRRVAEAKRKQEEYEKSFRTWKDATGKFSVEAQFVSFAAGTVKIRKRDGTVISLDQKKLSKTDREWIRDRAKGRH